MNKVAIITCFQSNEERCLYLNDYFINNGFNTDVYTTDFSHINKQYRDNIPDNFIAIKTNSYKSNLSIQRIMSHLKFSKDVFNTINNKDYDLIYLLAPANSLIARANRYKKKHPHTKIIIDMIDMWPESLPLSYNKHLFPFSIWRNLRKDNINVADYLISECDLYQDILKDEYHKDIKTIYLTRAKDKIRIKKDLDDKTLSLVYIGSINNLIDIDKITNMINKIDYPVFVHVIGEGEKTQLFLDQLRNVCHYQYHGPVHDEKLKAEIFNKCHAGINIYKDNLYIGLTTKCLDYFEYGLPIINNIKADTYNLVKEYNVGINIDDDLNIDVDKLIDLAHQYKHISKLYDDYFSVKTFNKNIDEVIKKVMNK